MELLLNADARILASLGYSPIKRTFKGMIDLLTPDQNILARSYNPDEEPYKIYESKLVPKLPNITYLPNLITSNGKIMLATTLGHQHTQQEKGDTRPFQELYEFFGYGAMLLRNQQRTRLHILQPKDKITTGTSDNMTFFNLSESPLITHDMANPSMNSAHKNLENEIGTMMLFTFYNGDLTVQINPQYYLRRLLGDAVPRSPIIIGGCKLGQSLYERFADYKDAFADSGIELVFGGNLPSALQKELSEPLLALVAKRNKTLLDSLGFE